MVRLRYLGHSSFLVVASDSTRIIIDPYDSWTWIGYPYPDVQGDIVLVSHEHFDHNAVGNLKGVSHVIRGVGKHQARGIIFEGLPSRHAERGGASVDYQNTIFHFLLDGLRICHLGDVGEVPNESVLSAIRGPDLALLPTGGYGHTIDPAQIPDLVDKIRPRIIVPMHYKVEGTSPPGIDLHSPDYWVRTYAPRGKILYKQDEIDLSTQSVPREREVWIMKPYVLRVYNRKETEAPYL